jgi:hypothetical protein
MAHNTRWSGRTGPHAAQLCSFGHKGTTMERHIVGFHQDEEQHWVAELECGHTQHVRHHAPWSHRPWVITAKGRANAIGRMLSCVKCDADAPPDRRP